MSDTPTDHAAQRSSVQDDADQINATYDGAAQHDAAGTTSLSTEDVEEQIREAESLHQDLTQRLKATAHQ